MKQVFDGGEIIAGAEVAAKPKVSSESAGKGRLCRRPDEGGGHQKRLLHPVPAPQECDASVTRLRAFLESNGDSVVVIEDDDVANCHVHTSDPGMMLSEAIKYGYLTDFKIENMHEQFLARQKQGKGLEKQAQAEEKKESEFTYAAVDPEREYGFVAVAAGEGLKNVFTDLGVDAVVSGGQTMNPSTRGYPGGHPERAGQDGAGTTQRSTVHGLRAGAEAGGPQGHCIAHPHGTPGHDGHAEL